MCKWLEWWTDDHKVIDLSLQLSDEIQGRRNSQRLAFFSDTRSAATA